MYSFLLIFPLTMLWEYSIMKQTHRVYLGLELYVDVYIDRVRPLVWPPRNLYALWSRVVLLLLSRGIGLTLLGHVFFVLVYRGDRFFLGIV